VGFFSFFTHQQYLYQRSRISNRTMGQLQLLLIATLSFFLVGCSTEKESSEMTVGCKSCHQVTLDTAHDSACTSCHQGNDAATEKDEAHAGLIALPAHPENMAKSCGACHPQIADHIGESLHYTLKNSTNLFRQAFGARKQLQSFIQTPEANTPEDLLALADDLLRRRCFRCHPYTKGDNYPAVARGTGCAACHLEYREGKLSSHMFTKPQDQQCLSCHYGNYVGADYYGRFENDLNVEYRTPYTTREEHFRPYGVEYHQLSPDIHREKGLGCVDCHSGEQIMTKNAPATSCQECHQLELMQNSSLQSITRGKEGLVFTSRDGRSHTLPAMVHPAHFNQQHEISCQACHAQWTYNDLGKHFMRSDTDNYDIFENLQVQGSSEVEDIIVNNTDFDKTELPLVMTDKLTGQTLPGIWYKSYIMRRWEDIVLGRDVEGRITTVRPLLDYSLSWVDEDDVVRFDSVGPPAVDTIYVPYTPHTTGAAGLFYMERIDALLQAEQSTKGQ
jgi:hypothetical protein